MNHTVSLFFWQTTKRQGERAPVIRGREESGERGGKKTNLSLSRCSLGVARLVVCALARAPPAFREHRHLREKEKKKQGCQKVTSTPFHLFFFVGHGRSLRVRDLRHAR